MEKTDTDPAEAVAEAVMHEGLVLYPYRPSALKNRPGWNLGMLMPPEFCARAQNGERSDLHIECLAEHGPDARLTVKVHFLQLREAGEPVPRVVTALARLGRPPEEAPFEFGAIRGGVRISAEPVADGTSKLTVIVSNRTPFAGDSRDDALGGALLSCQALLSIQGGAFFSMTEAPADLIARAACRNVGGWPVLVGPEGARDRMLASPIILGDYPRIAPQSPAVMFDGTEIDELLSLRIQTLTPGEKAELRRHPRTSALLDRIDSLAAGELAALHGAWRRPTAKADGLKPGDSVILRPKRRADIFDLALAGRRATVTSIECDFEDRIHVCVTVDDDPGRDLGREGKPGHRFFFDLDEVEKP
ncbi:MAG TPA: hypothetical protein VEB66_12030 [Opitutaceae bacterium]|nr:hypothetical protein [Opitutaceae bacterium]